MKDCVCSVCHSNEARICPECLFKEITKEIDRWQDIISQIQKI